MQHRRSQRALGMRTGDTVCVSTRNAVSTAPKGWRVGSSATAEEAELPHADVLVIESTYGKPAYRLPARDESIERLYTVVRGTLEAGGVPVVEAMGGTALVREVCAALTTPPDRCTGLPDCSS